MTTTGMIADAARAVAGERAEVIALMGPGIDPHLFSPTRSDIQRIMRADVVLTNGLMLEGKLADAFGRAAASGKPVHAVAEAIPRDRLLSPEEYEGQFDPHVWMDPTLWILVVEEIRDRLTAYDPGWEATYHSNAEAYIAELKALDAYAFQVLHSIPQVRRVLATAHDAFGYLGRRYGYEVMAIQGLSTESEASVRDIESLVEALVVRKVPAVFVESTVSDRNIRALVAGARARSHTIVIGGSLYSDAMGPAGEYTGTYLGMLDHNLTTIGRALGGDVPAGGLRGRLAP